MLASLIALLLVSDVGPVRYDVGLTAPQTQMVDMVARFPGAAPLEIQLPAWRPGRYEILDPAGTVREMHAWAGDGSPLQVEKTAKATWRITGEGPAPVSVSYRVYANSIGDRTRHVDDTHAFLSPSSVFVYAPTFRDHPCRVQFEAPDDWSVACGLDAPADDPGALVAPDYDILVDSPIEIGLHDTLTFEAAGGRRHDIVLWPPGVPRDDERLRDDFQAIVDACADVFGHVPYERYVFLIHVGAGGGGTEHLNSTIMQVSRAAIGGSRDESSNPYERLLGLTAHEFFHTWNVKQLRPAGIQPYDYQRENYTPLLWVAEGTTSYYDELLLVRVGLLKPDAYLDRLGKQITSLRTRPGARVQSLADSSFDAWIKFNRRHADSINSTVSFYAKGSLASLLLDLELRARTEGVHTLDSILRTMYQQFPLDDGGFTTEDLRAELESVAGDFGDFFTHYINGTAVLPFEDHFATVGLELEFEANDDDLPEGAPIPDRADLGLELSRADGRATVRAVLSDGPAYTAGVIAGDEIVALDGRRLGADLRTVLEHRRPGEVVELHVFRRDALRVIPVTLAGRPDGKFVVRRVSEASDAQRAAYEDWCGQSWPADDESGEE